MTIEEIKTKLDRCNIDSDTLIELTRYINKYQKIEQIYSDYLKYMNPDNLADRIGEVFEDGNDD